MVGRHETRLEHVGLHLGVGHAESGSKRQTGRWCDREDRGAGRGRIRHGGCRVVKANCARRLSSCVVFGERPVGNVPKTPNYACRIATCVIVGPIRSSARDFCVRYNELRFTRPHAAFNNDHDVVERVVRVYGHNLANIRGRNVICYYSLAAHDKSSRHLRASATPATARGKELLNRSRIIKRYGNIRCSCLLPFRVGFMPPFAVCAEGADLPRMSKR